VIHDQFVSQPPYPPLKSELQAQSAGTAAGTSSSSSSSAASSSARKRRRSSSSAAPSVKREDDDEEYAPAPMDEEEDDEDDFIEEEEEEDEDFSDEGGSRRRRSSRGGRGGGRGGAGSGRGRRRKGAVNLAAYVTGHTVSSEKTVEDLKARFYSIQQILLQARSGNDAETRKNPYMKNPYDPAYETERKRNMELLFQQTKDQTEELAQAVLENRKLSQKIKQVRKALEEKGIVLKKTAAGCMCRFRLLCY